MRWSDFKIYFLINCPLLNRKLPFLQSSLPLPLPLIPPYDYSETASSSKCNNTTIPQHFNILPFPSFPLPSFVGGGEHFGPLGHFANLAMNLAVKKRQQEELKALEEEKYNQEKNNFVKEKIKRRKVITNCKTRKRPFPSELNIKMINGDNEEVREINNYGIEQVVFFK